MGAYVSVPDCQAHYNVTLNCTLGTFDNATHKFESLGGITRGNFESDGDIAGIGVQGVFIGVTSFALALSIFDLVWQASKTLKWKRTLSKEERMKNPKKRSASDIMETLVQACSDQQIFTGAAYALALRYWRGCTISAYHYNLVANMMLLTCATHLMSVTIIRNYWKYPWLAVLRVLCVSGVFVVTGVLMSNQNVPDNPNFVFPTSVPPRNETDSLMFLPAACFQNASASLTDIFRDSTSSSTQFFVNAIGNSTPRNKIQGWRWYLIMLFFYGAAMIAEFIRFCRRNQTRQGWRANLAASVKRLIGTGGKRRTIIKYLFLLYLVAGIGISTTTVIFTASYIMSLRQWVDQSRWVALKNGQNPENDATSFGQLVPIFLSALVLFSFLQTLSEKLTDHDNRKHANDPKPPPAQTGTIGYFDPSHYDLMEMGQADTKLNGQDIATPGTMEVQSGNPWADSKPTVKPSDATQAATPGDDAYAASPSLGNGSFASAVAMDINPQTLPATEYGLLGFHEEVTSPHSTGLHPNKPDTTLHSTGPTVAPIMHHTTESHVPTSTATTQPDSQFYTPITQGHMPTPAIPRPDSLGYSSLSQQPDSLEPRLQNPAPSESPSAPRQYFVRNPGSPRPYQL